MYKLLDEALCKHSTKIKAYSSSDLRQWKHWNSRHSAGVSTPNLSWFTDELIPWYISSSSLQKGNKLFHYIFNRTNALLECRQRERLHRIRKRFSLLLFIFLNVCSLIRSWTHLLYGAAKRIRQSDIMKHRESRSTCFFSCSRPKACRTKRKTFPVCSQRKSSAGPPALASQCMYLWCWSPGDEIGWKQKDGLINGLDTELQFRLLNNYICYGKLWLNAWIPLSCV